MNLKQRIRRMWSGTPDDLPSECENGCGRMVAPFAGVRTHGHVYCSEDCSVEDWGNSFM